MNEQLGLKSDSASQHKHLFLAAFVVFALYMTLVRNGFNLNGSKGTPFLYHRRISCERACSLPVDCSVWADPF